MSQIDNETFECDECGKIAASPNPGAVYSTRPEQWLTLVIFDKWFDGSEGLDPALERNYCSLPCYNAGRHNLPSLPEGDTA